MDTSMIDSRMMWVSSVLIWLLLLSSCQGKLNYHPIPYIKGDVVPVECMVRVTDDTAKAKLDTYDEITYTSLPVCMETGTAPSIRYGKESHIKCTWSVTEGLFNLLQKVLLRDIPFHCRIPISKDDHYSYSSMSVNLAGQVDRTHVHVAPEMNVLLHASNGLIVGSTAYSVGSMAEQDLVKVKQGESVTMSIRVVWSRGVDIRTEASLNTIRRGFVYCISLTAFITLSVAYMLQRAGIVVGGGRSSVVVKGD